MLKRLPTFALLPMLILLLMGCDEKPERHLDLGLWYYQKGLVDDAILEFKEVIRLLPSDPRRLTRRELDIVARAHYNLAVAYAKKKWYELALVEAEKTFELRPTPENYNLQELIRQRKDLESLSSASKTAPG
ncbi:hypothetical protein ES707_04342 [subsurface metagenome]